jgi:hypothetical protein
MNHTDINTLPAHGDAVAPHACRTAPLDVEQCAVVTQNTTRRAAVGERGA